MKIAFILMLSCLSGYLYRRGGSGKGTLWRDCGCGIVSLLVCIVLGLKTSLYASMAAYFISFGLSWAFLASYWSFGKDMKFKNWFLHGLGLALAVLPIVILTWPGHWLGFGLRLVVLPLLVAGWSSLIGLDVLEEAGRGLLFIATMLLFLL